MEQVTFDSLPLSSGTLQAIADMGFTLATPIQSQAIPLAIQGLDVLGQAQTGTGKTAAFGIPIVEAIDSNSRETQALVLCPTRELAAQIAEEIKKIAKYEPNLNVVAIYGGDSYERQLRELKRGAQVVIGTPGRVIDHLERGTLKTDAIRIAVLDEADEMLNMGFLEDMEKILGGLPEDRQTMLFSATMPKPILELTKKFLHEPAHVKIERTTLTASSIAQYYFTVKSNQKVELMARLIEKYDVKLAITFCNTKRMVDELVAELHVKGVQAEGLHGDMSQSQRTSVMSRFRNGITHILVATDVAARGIDVNDVDAVFNYDIPNDIEQYVHRIGRTGRAGKTGISFSFITPRELGKLREIERFTKSRVEKGEIPMPQEIVQLRRERFAGKVKAAVAEGGLENFSALINQLVAEGYSAEDLAAALAKMAAGEINRPFGELDIITDRSSQQASRFGRGDGFSDNSRRDGRGNGRSERGSSYGRREESSRGGYQRAGNDKMIRLFVGLGRNEKISKGDILGAIANETGINGKNIGSIEVFDKFSFVEIREQDVQMVMRVMGKRKIKGKYPNMEIAD
ncbi:DEAD/DEAH box helicase [Rhodoflexus caldus]|uniref:DEAD/DEAH box helicase n=1 Tax=Rhodoflexus caldus TaxID=2891236 RepID=UPI00202A1111|nr:DEAD/DEAH box helicase [Rhodoflexus caldus]